LARAQASLICERPRFEQRLVFVGVGVYSNRKLPP
jgi:hypothetical protein